jgi:hypothetical protein
VWTVSLHLLLEVSVDDEAHLLKSTRVAIPTVPLSSLIQ